MKQKPSDLLVPGCLAVTLFLAVNGSDTVAADTPNAGNPAFQYEEPKTLTGSICACDTRQLLFKFQRTSSRSGSTVKVQRDFTYPDGKLAARERAVYEGDALVSYDLEETQIGATGDARVHPTPESPLKGRIEFQYRREAGGRARVSTETLQESTLIGDMIGPFLAAHWDAL